MSQGAGSLLVVTRISLQQTKCFCFYFFLVRNKFCPKAYFEKKIEVINSLNLKDALKTAGWGITQILVSSFVSKQTE